MEKNPNQKLLDEAARTRQQQAAQAAAERFGIAHRDAPAERFGTPVDQERTDWREPIVTDEPTTPAERRASITQAVEMAQGMLGREAPGTPAYLQAEQRLADMQAVLTSFEETHPPEQP